MDGNDAEASQRERSSLRFVAGCCDIMPLPWLQIRDGYRCGGRIADRLMLCHQTIGGTLP